MKKKFILPAAFLFFCVASGGTLSSSPAYAQQEMGSMSYYSISPAEIQSHYHEWAVFLEYHLHREQCQHYQKPPEGFVQRGCDIYRVGGADASTSSYTVLFDFNRSDIRKSEKSKLDDIAREIKARNPTYVTVSGYTDRSGSIEYNQALSERRTQAVVNVLSAYGVRVKVDNQSSYGEADSAVATADGVRMQENRRVVIYFNK